MEFKYDALNIDFMQGKKLVFVTNNSRKSRRQYSNKFRALGLEVTAVVFYTTTQPDSCNDSLLYCNSLLSSLQEEIFTSSFAAAMFLKLNNFSTEKKVSCIIFIFVYFYFR